NGNADRFIELRRDCSLEGFFIHMRAVERYDFVFRVQTLLVCWRAGAHVFDVDEVAAVFEIGAKKSYQLIEFVPIARKTTLVRSVKAKTRCRQILLIRKFISSADKTSEEFFQTRSRHQL